MFHASLSGAERKTVLGIEGEKFTINGEPTYKGVTWNGHRIEGLLMNARLVQGIFDDLNPDTVDRWVYPDTGEWDPDRNTQGYVDAMASWYEHGLRCFVINLQGGSPEGYSQQQPWENSAFNPGGSLRDDYMDRLERILDRADELGMVAMVGYFYFGQDDRLEDEQAVIRAVDNASEWILERGYRNVLIEINNECNIRYDHAILQPQRVHELIERVRQTEHEGRSLPAGTSYGGGTVPGANVVEVSDFVLLHGNGVSDPQRMEDMIQAVREMDAYRGQPIVNNEDDQPWRVAAQGFGHEGNNFVASVRNGASWGYFDFRLNHELDDFNHGFQTVPANWQISSDRKREFFDFVAEMTGSPGTPRVDLILPEESVLRSGDPIDLRVRVENEREQAPIEQIELLLNNEVVAEAEAGGEPFTFRLDQLPVGEGMVRARATYHSGDMKVIVESPYRTLRVMPEPEAAFNPDGDGRIVVRAVDHHEATAGTMHEQTWTETEHPGAPGPVMQALPDMQQILGPGRSSPRMDYHVHFDEPGVYHVWVRGLAGSGDQDSVHVGLNGEAPQSTQHIYPFEPFDQWVWTNTNREGERAVIEVPGPGVHTVNVWMREDGFLMDRFVLTRDSDYAPEDEGPEPSPHQPL
ncbi:MAG: hypothetical protein WD490_04110 [Opitutales bacterium]